MKKRSHALLVLVLMVSLSLSACGILKADRGEIARSDLNREANPPVTPAGAQALLEGNNRFAFDLYHQVAESGGNLVFSPYSISLAMAMLYGGAGGETAAQIAATLHFTLPPEQLHPAWNALAQDLEQRPAQSKKIDRKNPMELSIANAVWGQVNYPFEKGYLDLLAVNYGAGLRVLDFAAAPEKSRRSINDWVDNQTRGKITDLLPPGSIDPSMRLGLTNTVYFYAAWQEAFVKQNTRQAAFTLLDGSQVNVPMMDTRTSIPVSVYEAEDYLAVALPYKGDLAEMVIILPEPGAYRSVESKLDAAGFAGMLEGLTASDMTVFMPKFEFTAGLDLQAVLKGMGLPVIFDRDRADFSKITQAERLYVMTAVHKAHIQVDEEGTAAEAATFLGIAPASLPVELHIDRPFIFVIRDVPSGSILFVGRVLNPLEQ